MTAKQTSPVSQRTALALMAVTPAMFCTNMLIAKGMSGVIPPVALAFWRWTATLALVLVIFGRSLWLARRALWQERLELLLLGALGMGVCGAFVYIGAATTTATNIGLIYAASPVLIILLGTVLYGEPMRPLQGLGVAISLVGVLVVIAKGDPSVLLHLRFTVGDLWVLTSVIAWGIYSVVVRYRPSAAGLNERFGGIVLGGVLSLLPFMLAEAVLDRPAPLRLDVVLAVALLAVVASFGAYQTYALIQRALGASRAGLIFYLTPLYNAFLAFVFLGERLALFHVLGVLLVLPGIFLATRR